MKRMTLIAAPLSTALLCTGCEVGMSIDSRPTEAPAAEATTRSAVGRVQEIRLKDGTRCVTWYYGNGGGLSCDWKHGA